MAMYLSHSKASEYSHKFKAFISNFQKLNVWIQFHIFIAPPITMRTRYYRSSVYLSPGCAYPLSQSVKVSNLSIYSSHIED